MAYLLDANTFIDAKNRYYDFDVCPGFWGWLDQRHASGAVLSVEAVGNELLAGNDPLSTWAAARPGFFEPPDPQVVTSLQLVAAWANSSQFRPAGISEFLQSPDSVLVAHAHAHEHVVVTHERVDQGTRRIRIPAPCAALGVRCMNPFEMLRLEHATFVLGTRP